MTTTTLCKTNQKSSAAALKVPVKRKSRTNFLGNYSGAEIGGKRGIKRTVMKKKKKKDRPWMEHTTDAETEFVAGV